MPRKKSDVSPFDIIEQQLRDIAKSINSLGNSLNDKETQKRMKMIFDHLIVDAYRIRMIKDYTLTNANVKILIQKGEHISDATPSDIWRAFISRWESMMKDIRYKEEDLWK